MAKTKISEYDSTAANNTDVDGINIAESCPPSGINNAIREVMAHLKDWQSGVSGDKLPIASGGTNAGTAADARTNLGLGSLAVKSTVATADIDADAVDGTKIADDSIDSEHYVDGSIDTVHIGDSQVTSAKIANDNVTADELNVSGDGTSGQVLSSDGDGSFSWVDQVSGIGDGQTISNLTSSRSTGVTYTNSTGRTIVAMVYITYSAYGSSTAYVDSKICGSFSNQFGDRPGYASFTLIIPDGKTYLVSGGSVSAWTEIR